MKISVIVPVYNVPHDLLKNCLSSLAKQTLRANEYEILIVDDCSTDSECTAIADEFASSLANARLIRREVNGGLNEARRTGLDAAAGDYIVFVDGDDMLTRDAVENLRMEAHRTRADLVAAPFWRWSPATKTYADLPIVARRFSADRLSRLKDTLAGRHSFTMCGRLFKKDILKDGVMDMPPGILHEDLKTFVRFMFRANNISQVTRPLYYYTINGASITNNFTRKHAEDFFDTGNEWLTLAKKYNVLDELRDSISEGIEKITNTCVRRCLSTSRDDEDEKARTLAFIFERYDSFPARPLTAKYSNTRALQAIGKEKFAARPDLALKDAQDLCYYEAPDSAPPLKLLPKGIEPSFYAKRLKDKIVFVCQVDYQLRNAAAFARELRSRGHACVILDNSAFASGGLRQLPPEENGIFYRTEHLRIPKPPYGPDWLSTAKAVIVFNDFNDDFREALEFRQRLELPTICAVEGINDFLRVDFEPYRHLPYRRCDYVFLAGNDDKQYFTDRKTFTIGLPIINSLAEKHPIFPNKPLAALNINFTYGVFETAREEYIETAKRAFETAGFDWKITQHPADRGNLQNLPVTEKTQYTLIDECSVFVSRFATGILEALASGKPVIYFNPHGEKVQKFKNPMGAYEIANTEEELIAALTKVKQEIVDGVDFRKRALPFLKHHTNFEPAQPSAVKAFADAITDIVYNALPAQDRADDLFFEALERQTNYSCTEKNVIIGDFDRSHNAQLNDEEMLSHFFGEDCNIMIDVGANFGNSCDVYLGKGWTVHAFEPDPNNRRALLAAWPENPRLIVNSEAVSDTAGDEVAFYASDESSGISGLSAFTENHREIARVKTTTLREYYSKAGLTHVNFLKIDVEGFDKFVLDGFPWEKDLPDVVLAEFEDVKTVPLGYNAHDLAKTMISKGYSVYVSEWHPIIRYGIAHDWRRFIKYSPDLDLSTSWGNFIGFREDPSEDLLRKLIQRTLKFAPRAVPTPEQNTQTPPQNKAPASMPVTKRPFYAAFGERLRKRAPRLFTLAQIGRRVLAGLWRRKVWTIPAVAALTLIALSGFIPALSDYRTLLWGAAAFGVAMFAILYLGLRVYLIARGLSTEIAELRRQRDTLQQQTNALRRQIDDLRSTVKTHGRSIQQNSRNTQQNVSKLEERVARHESAAASEFGAIHAEVQDLNTTTQNMATAQQKLSGVQSTVATIQNTREILRTEFMLQRERITASERQIGDLRFPHAPRCFVLFGHHKCGSRFFRDEVFARVADVTDARIRRYKIENGPFHYSRSEDLDLANMDLEKLGQDRRDVVLFSNATERSLEKIRANSADWKGVRIIRDPRQVLISNYIHHKGSHIFESKVSGWVWDKLAHDKPILRELPEEEGILYELDNITKEIIEEQLLGHFDDDRIMTVKLEDFAQSPREWLSRISQFLAVPQIAGIDFAKAHANPESRYWRDCFTPEIKKIFKARYGEALIQIGYEDNLDW